jgi:hypothetical protein
VTALVAHRGVGGVIVEVALLLLVLAVFAAVWQRSQPAEEPEEGNDR